MFVNLLCLFVIRKRFLANDSREPVGPDASEAAQSYERRFLLRQAALAVSEIVATLNSIGLIPQRRSRLHARSAHGWNRRGKRRNQQDKGRRRGERNAVRRRDAVK